MREREDENRSFKLHEKFHLLGDSGGLLTGNNHVALKPIPVFSECHFLQFVFCRQARSPLTLFIPRLLFFLLYCFLFLLNLFSSLD